MGSQQLQSLLHKEVSRKEFLGILGLAAISVLGFGHILKLLTGKSLDTHRALHEGYGASAYGGKER
jgi:hypothetical protein